MKKMILNAIIALLLGAILSILLFPMIVEKTQEDLVSTVNEIYEQAFNGQPITYEQTLEIEKKYNEIALQGLTGPERDRLDGRIRIITDAYHASSIPVSKEFRNDPHD